MSNPPTRPRSTAKQIPYHMSEAEIRYRIIVLLEAVERLGGWKVVVEEYRLTGLEDAIEGVVAASEFLKQGE